MQECAAQVQCSTRLKSPQTSGSACGSLWSPSVSGYAFLWSDVCGFFSSSAKLSLNRLHTMKCPLHFPTKWWLFKLIQMPKKTSAFCHTIPESPPGIVPPGWDCTSLDQGHGQSLQQKFWEVYWECLCFPEASFILPEILLFCSKWFLPSSSGHVWTVPLKPLH